MATPDEMPTLEASQDGEVREGLGRVREGGAAVEKDRVFSSLHGKLFGDADPVTVGRFVVEGKLGAGAMGVVYAARDPELDRRVAIKLLRDGSSGDEATARLEREARALARLRHPNVVTVYEVGSHGGDRFIAMDLVDGVTLRRWLLDRPRWRQILEIFVEAGRGLAAAHDAGLVHRDFKPDNVLVEHGHARVVDFGLARPQLDAAGDSVETEGLSSSDLTRSGTILGTPAYMAPEAFSGESDESTDQFAYCVSLYEALYGVRPFAGETMAAVLGAVLDGKLQRPERTGVPPWLRRLTVRGLSYDAAQRWPSMRELLSEIERRRRRPYARALVITGVAGTAAGALVMSASTREAPRCERSSERLSAAWSKARQRSIRTAFERTGIPYAPGAWTLAEESLDAYASRWLDLRYDACQATYDRGEQSEAIFDARMQCMDRRLEEFDALIAALEAPDASVVSHTVTASRRLSPVEDCADEAVLRAQLTRADGAGDVPAPPELYARLAGANAGKETGKYVEALAEAHAVALDAGAGHHTELAALAYHSCAVLEQRLARHDAAEGSALLAIGLAEQLGDDTLRARAQLQLISVLAAKHSVGRAEDWVALTHATVHRLGDPIPLRAHLAAMESNVLSSAARYEESLAVRRRALELYSEFRNPDAALLADTHKSIADSLVQLGRHNEALVNAEETLRLRILAFGENHPEVAKAHSALAFALQAAGQVDKAASQAQVAVDIAERALGSEDVLVGEAYVNLAIATAQSSNPTEAAVFFRRALGIYEVANGRDNITVGHVLGNLGRVLAFQGDSEEAIAVLGRALAIHEKVLGHQHVDLMYVLNNLAVAQRGLERHEDALTSARRALGIGEANFGNAHALVADAWLQLAMSQRLLGRFSEAIASLKTALSIHGQIDSRLAAVALVRLELVRAYAAAGQLPLAIEAARHARDEAGRDTAGGDAEVKQLDDWLAKHAPD